MCYEEKFEKAVHQRWPADPSPDQVAVVLYRSIDCYDSMGVEFDWFPMTEQGQRDVIEKCTASIRSGDGDRVVRLLFITVHNVANDSETTNLIEEKLRVLGEFSDVEVMYIPHGTEPSMIPMNPSAIAINAG